MSPVFSSSGAITPRILLAAEDLARSYSRLKPYDAKFAYLNILGNSSDSKTIKHLDVARSEGWDLVPKDTVINYWDKKLPFVLPKNFSLSVGRYFDPNMRSPFCKSIRDNFNAPPTFRKELDTGLKKVEPNIRIVNIIHESGAIAASGLTATFDEHCFLFCGSVSKPFRRRGLWKSLVAARQMISGAQGASFWITSTSNPRIMNKKFGSFQVFVLKKDLKLIASK